MLSCQTAYSIAPWVSYRTYLPNSADSRTLIFNEKNHDYLLLEGDSSDIWFYLSKGKPFEFLTNYASNQDIDKETLVLFLAELSEAELLVSGDVSENYNNTTLPVSFSAQDKNTPDAQQLEDEISEWAWSKGFLFSIHWEITYRCNEICIHCFNPGAAHKPDEIPNRNRDELTTTEAFNLIDDLVKVGVFHLTISGGEATLRKDFFEIVQYARQNGLCVMLYTNGLRLTDDFIEKLKKLWLHSVEISIYSSNPEIHDQITKVPKSFEKSVNALRKLTESNIRGIMKSVQMKHTIQGYELTREFGEKIGVQVEIEALLSPAIDGNKSPLNHELPFAEMVALSATAGSPLYVGDKNNNWGRKNMQKAFNLPVCGAGRKRLAIDPEGQITPCTVMPIKVGSVRKEGVYTTWERALSQSRMPVAELNNDNSSKNLSPDKFLGYWQNIVLSSFDECGTHERCAWCRGLCPGDALLQTDNPLAAAETHCLESSARMTAAKMLMSGLNQEMIYAQLGVSTDFGRQYDSRTKSVYPHFQLQPIR